MRLSLQPSPASETSALSRIRAFRTRAAGCLPLLIRASSVCLSSALRRTTYFLTTASDMTRFPPAVDDVAREARKPVRIKHAGHYKWNKIEHRLFSFITQNWRGKPLISYLVIVQLIASTTTDTGLTVACRLDETDYAKGIKVTNAEMAALNIQPAEFHGEWNYTIAPRRPDG